MDLQALQAEFAARGFDYLNTTRQNYYLNYAYQVSICEAEDWPFLEATTSGVAPLAISDLRTLASVIDSTQSAKLLPLDNRNITDDIDTSLTTTGSPVYYYLSSGSTVSVYPANTTDTLSVRYWKVPTALSAATDTPSLPTRFHPLIVDAAVARAYEDSDNQNEAQAAEAIFQSRFEQMRESLMQQQHDEPDEYIVVSDSESAPFLTWSE